MRKTNTEFVTDLMDFGGGPMVQLFVIGALSNMAEQVLSATPEEIEELLPPIVNADAWIEAARIVRAAMDKQYGREHS